MHTVTLKTVAPGQVLAQEITSPDQKITIGRGTVLTEFWITRLKEWGIKKLVVNSLEPEESSIDGVQALLRSVLQPAEQKKSPGQQAREKFLAVCNSVESELYHVFVGTRCTRRAPLKMLRALADNLYALMSIQGAFLYLHSPVRAEKYLYRHAVDVALLAGFIGQWLGLGEADIKSLIFAGLIHDIGKAGVMFEIISKPGRLDAAEKDSAKRHVEHSRKLLSDAGLDLGPVMAAVTQHHERVDGSGYPAGLNAGDIHPYAKILAIADVYDALTSDRYYRQGISPIEAAEVMVFDMSGHFDPDILSKLCERLRHFLFGAKVRLSNGAIGEVIFFHPFPEMRPIVRLEDGSSLDISARRDITITSLNFEN